MTPYLILIGADHRKLGKSTLAARLADILSTQGHTVYALKIRGTAKPVSRFRRENEDEQKPSVRALLDAGCRSVFYIETGAAGRRECFDEVLRSLPDEPLILIVESSALRLDLVPDLFIHLDGGGSEIKPSALETRHLADIRIRAPFDDGDIALILERLERDLKHR